MGRASFSKLVLHIHPRLVPEASAKVRFTWCLGGLAAWMFVIELLTGALLLLYYVPTPSEAYRSVQDITHVVPYGFFVRNLHYWAGQIMVVLVFLHMFRVVVTGSYRRPRHMNWLIGVGLLLSTLIVDFSGYLLIWDDRALWAWTIARNLVETVPWVGSPFAVLLFGPPDIGPTVLVRLFAWHVFVIPGAMILLTGWHFWRIRRDGGISLPL